MPKVYKSGTQNQHSRL